MKCTGCGAAPKDSTSNKCAWCGSLIQGMPAPRPQNNPNQMGGFNNNAGFGGGNMNMAGGGAMAAPRRRRRIAPIIVGILVPLIILGVIIGIPMACVLGVRVSAVGDTNIHLDSGHSTDLQARATGIITSLEWRSSNPTVASVWEGSVTAHNPGVATIYAVSTVNASQYTAFTVMVANGDILPTVNFTSHSPEGWRHRVTVNFTIVNNTNSNISASFHFLTFNLFNEQAFLSDPLGPVAINANSSYTGTVNFLIYSDLVASLRRVEFAYFVA